MNYNIIAYTIYLPLTFLITVKVGWILYKNGEVFILHLLNQNLQLTQNINNLLLIGYYLINLGYASMTLSWWNEITSFSELMNEVSFMLGKIILLLALMHYNNIFWLNYLTKSKITK